MKHLLLTSSLKGQSDCTGAFETVVWLSGLALLYPLLGLLFSSVYNWGVLFECFEVASVSPRLHSIFGEGNGTPLQCSCLDNTMDGGAWKAAVHGVAEGRARLSDFTFTFHFPALVKEMATRSSVLAWRIPGMGEPGGLPSGVAQSWTRLK